MGVGGGPTGGSLPTGPNRKTTDGQNEDGRTLWTKIATFISRQFRSAIKWNGRRIERPQGASIDDVRTEGGGGYLQKQT